MKTPRFEEMANRWSGKAQFFILFSREAHPQAGGLERLSGFGRELMERDQNGDNMVTFKEFGGPRAYFIPFDMNNDGVVHSHEILAATKISQFADVDDPTSLVQRVALARKYREECPGSIDILIDGIANEGSQAFGGWPNSAFIIDAEGNVAHRFEWANERDIEAALVQQVGGDAPPIPQAREIDWGVVETQLAAAESKGRDLLIEFTAPGCRACEAMETRVLAKDDVAKALEGYEVVKLGVEQDAHWALFEALGLSATPAFVRIGPGRTLGNRVQGFTESDALLRFLSP